MAATEAPRRRRSLKATHERIGELGWSPTYHKHTPENALYPTRYKLPEKIGRDAMRQVMGDYLNMQLEKDDRVFGGLDAALRAEVPHRAPLRVLEQLKPLLVTIVGNEMGAFRCMSLLIEAIKSPELQNAYYLQMLDEQRHTGIQMARYRLYMTHQGEPTGWNLGFKASGKSPAALAAFNMSEQFIPGDPIQAAIMTQEVIETGFSNPVNVMYPDVAARNGDFALATVTNSVQSDEARHINNGYATLLYCLQEPDNVPLIEQDISQMYWCVASFADAAVGVLTDYATVDRSDPVSWLDKYDRWIMDDYYRSYIVNLKKLGVNIPESLFERARQRIADGRCHKAAIGAWSDWPFAWYRLDTLNERDFEWFENQYPGWYSRYGWFWESRLKTQHRDEAALTPGLSVEEGGPLCWTCHQGSFTVEDRCHRIVDDHTRFYCSPECKWIDETNPGRFIGHRNFFDYYHGVEYSEVVQDLGFVRPDGKTLVGQPHCDTAPEKQWTLADLKAADVHVRSNNVVIAEQLGLPYKRPFRYGADPVQTNGNGNGHPGPQSL
jgi:propane 2-monooxygenase large subunit